MIKLNSPTLNFNALKFKTPAAVKFYAKMEKISIQGHKMRSDIIKKGYTRATFRSLVRATELKWCYILLDNNCFKTRYLKLSVI